MTEQITPSTPEQTMPDAPAEVKAKALTLDNLLDELIHTNNAFRDDMGDFAKLQAFSKARQAVEDRHDAIWRDVIGPLFAERDALRIKLVAAPASDDGDLERRLNEYGTARIALYLARAQDDAMAEGSANNKLSASRRSITDLFNRLQAELSALRNEQEKKK